MKREVKRALKRVSKMDYTHLTMLRTTAPSHIKENHEEVYSYVLANLVESYLNKDFYFLKLDEKNDNYFGIGCFDDSDWLFYEICESVCGDFECISFTYIQKGWETKRTSNYVKEVAEKFRPYYA